MRVIYFRGCSLVANWREVFILEEQLLVRVAYSRGSLIQEERLFEKMRLFWRGVYSTGVLIQEGRLFDRGRLFRGSFYSRGCVFERGAYSEGGGLLLKECLF